MTNGGVSALEPDYERYTHGSNVNTHLKRPTYASITNSAIAALASSSASGPGGLRHSSAPKMLHGYGAPAGSAARPPPAAPATAAPAEATTASSYQAFGHSACHRPCRQPATASILALHAAPPPCRASCSQQPSQQPLAPSGAASMPVPPTATTHHARKQRPKPRPEPMPQPITATALENDMAAAGFMHMHSMYNLKRADQKLPPRRVHAQGPAPTHATPAYLPPSLAYAMPLPPRPPAPAAQASPFHSRPPHDSRPPRPHHHNPMWDPPPALSSQPQGAYKPPQKDAHLLQSILHTSTSLPLVKPKKQVHFAL